MLRDRAKQMHSHFYNLDLNLNLILILKLDILIFNIFLFSILPVTHQLQFRHRIVLVYKPPSTASLDDLTPLLNKLKKLVDVPHPCTLIGDFNFPKINWAAHQAAQPAGLSAGEKAFMTFCAQNGLRQIITFATRLDKQLDILLTNSMGSFPHNCQKLNSQLVGIKTDHEPFECRFHFGFADVP
jgi:hypothetical protein